MKPTQHFLSEEPTEEPADDEIILVSKSEIKRDMHALRDMGAKLMELKPSLLDTLTLDDRLKEALEESRRIKSKNARKRHLGFIGKLMRQQDEEHLEQIQQLLDRMDASSEEYNRHFHRLERWRERLIEEGTEAVTDYLQQHPHADHQHLRQMVRNAQKERHQQRPPSAARKLFKYLREVAGQ